ncbi:MAG: 4Fe-4S dicluster domain-containing protein [Candidatus Bathyarchaeia archaeon]
MHEVANTPRGEGILWCIQCGRCAGSCPVARMTTAYNPRRFMEMIILGLSRKTMYDLAWHCLSCFTCLDRCPQGADTGEVVLAVRSIAARGGDVPKSVAAMAKRIIETGHLVNPTGSVRTQRQKLGLPELTPVKDVQIIMRNTGLDRIVGYHQGKGPKE